MNIQQNCPREPVRFLLFSASLRNNSLNTRLATLARRLEHLGTRVFPDMFLLATAHQAFTQEGNVTNTTLAERFESNLVAFMNLVEAAKHYPCIKKACVDFWAKNPIRLQNG